LPAKEIISSSAFESEIALIIKDNSDHIRKELAGIRRIMSYDLTPKPSQFIYDTYYDTGEKLLRGRKTTLRIRKIDGALLVSTKSDIRRIARNIIRRREIERPWSYDSIRLVATTLKLKTPTVSVSQFQSVPVSNTLATMGLEVIQERRTQREARNIVASRRTPVSTLAEFAIDHVTYTFGKITVELSEIEIEAKAPRSLSPVREVADTLVSKYGPYVQQWFHGKFVTGLAIQSLVKTKALQSYMLNGELAPGAFELIESAIGSGEF
jgi:inorganic triphosphatase YgiF